VLPPNTGCQGFGIRFDAVGGNQHEHVRLGKDGKPRLVMLTGTGPSQTVTNTDSGKSITLRSNGVASRTTAPNAKGISTVTVTGHSILSLFPTDKPAGPSTRLIIGRVVFTTDAASNFEVKSISGRTVDLCALIA